MLVAAAFLTFAALGNLARAGDVKNGWINSIASVVNKTNLPASTAFLDRCRTNAESEAHPIVESADEA